MSTRTKGLHACQSQVCTIPKKRIVRASPALLSTLVPNKYGSSLSVAGNERTEGNWEKKFKGGIKIHLSHVGGINAHSSVGESKEPEGGDRINLVTRG